ncbi:unnamed protein product [Penicillium pancosmium]
MPFCNIHDPCGHTSDQCRFAKPVRLAFAEELFAPGPASKRPVPSSEDEAPAPKRAKDKEEEEKKEETSKEPPKGDKALLKKAKKAKQQKESRARKRAEARAVKEAAGGLDLHSLARSK